MRLSIERATVHIEDAGSRLHVRFNTDDADLFRALLDDLRRTFPRHADRVWNEAARAWSIPAWQRRRVIEWVECWFTADAIDWPGESVGASERPRPMGLSDAYRRLWVIDGAPLWAAEAVYRAAIKFCHPDAGGRVEDAVVVNEAMRVIRESQRVEQWTR